jgi:hypothetical protein
MEALPRGVKKLLKFAIPESLVVQRRTQRMESIAGLSNGEIFSLTYRNFLWGRKKNDFNFYSGDGSHDPRIVDDYVSKISDFLSQFTPKPIVVDIGCGDFHIGQQLSQFTRHYIACDVVPELINSNKNKYKINNVSFKVLDATLQELPKGEIVILRQVLQHLSNHDIQKILQKIEGNFRYLVFTDHQPSNIEWIPNLDKQTGPNIRTEISSGLELTENPFNLSPISSEKVSDVKVEDGVIRTFIYRLENI